MTDVVTNQIPDGLAAAPSLAFQSEPTTGFFKKSAGKIGIAVAGVEVGELSANGMLGETKMAAVTFQAAGAHVFTGTIPLPAGAILIDVGLHGLVVWTAGTSADIIVGDDVDPDGFFTTTSLKTADLLAGETNNIEHPGGKAGAFIVSEQRDIYRAAARNIVGVVTQVGASNTGTTIMYAVYAVPRAIAPVTTS